MGKIGFFTHDPEGTLGETAHAASWIRLHWNLYHEAVKRGAAGFIGSSRTTTATGTITTRPTDSGKRTSTDKPIPGFWVDRDHGERIRRLARDGKTSARLVLTGKIENGVTHNVIGEVKGESDEVFLIACHHDSPFNSAVEDASGCSVVLAAAKAFRRFPAGTAPHSDGVLHRRHFYGSVGTRTFIERARQSGLLDRIALEFHVEHIAREAVEDGAGKLVTLDRPEPAGIFVSFKPPHPERARGGGGAGKHHEGGGPAAGGRFRGISAH